MPVFLCLHNTCLKSCRASWSRVGLFCSLNTHWNVQGTDTKYGKSQQWASPSFWFAAGTQCSERWLGWMDKVPERWDHLYSGGGVMHRAGSITGFSNWRLTFSKTSLITLEINHMESKEYIAYLSQKHTLNAAAQVMSMSCWACNWLWCCHCLLSLTMGSSDRTFWDGLLGFGH